MGGVEPRSLFSLSLFLNFNTGASPPASSLAAKPSPLALTKWLMRCSRIHQTRRRQTFGVWRFSSQRRMRVAVFFFLLFFFHYRRRVESRFAFLKLFSFTFPFVILKRTGENQTFACFEKIFFFLSPALSF